MSHCQKYRILKSSTACLIVMISVVFASMASAAMPPAAGTIGLMASMQSEQVDILVPCWVSASINLAPSARFVSIGDAYSDYGVGASLRFYRRSENVSPYVGIRSMALFVSPKTGNGWTDFVIGGAFGGDYFLDEHFSVGVEAQLNVTKSAEESTRFGNPGGTNINSAMGVFAAVYF